MRIAQSDMQSRPDAIDNRKMIGNHINFNNLHRRSRLGSPCDANIPEVSSDRDFELILNRLTRRDLLEFITVLRIQRTDSMGSGALSGKAAEARRAEPPDLPVVGVQG